MTALLWLGLVACTGGPGEDTAVARNPSLLFDVAASETVAGVAVDFKLELGDELGAIQPESWALTSSREDPIAVLGESVRPEVAGIHELSVVVRYDGVTYSGSDTLEVLAAPPSALAIALSEPETEVGVPVGYSLSVADAFGNALAPDAVTVSADGDLSVGAGVVQSTRPGWFDVTATLGDLEATDTLRVHAGAPAEVTLALHPLPPRLGETANALVQVTDRFGNPTGTAWTLSSDPPDLSTVTQRHVRFDAEGWHTVKVRVTGTDLQASAGPYLIDGTAPVLVVFEPPRGTRTTAEQLMVTGTVADEWSAVDLLVGGGSAIVIDDAFSEQVNLDWGMTVVETEAWDDSGNSTADSRAVLSGDWLSETGEVTRGIEVRLEDGPGGLGEIEDLAAGLVGAADLAAYIPSPVYDNISESCFDPCWIGSCEICFTWYALTLYADSPRLGWTDLDIDPRADGTLGLDFIAGDLGLNWHANATVAEIDFSGSGSIVAQSIRVNAVVRPTVSGGDVGVQLVSTSASAAGFDFRMDSWLVRALEFFGVPIDKWVEQYMVSAIEDTVIDVVGPFVAAAIQDLELSYPVSVGSGTMTVTATPRDVVVDDVSLRLALGTRVSVSEGRRAAAPTFYGGYELSRWQGGVAATSALNLDFANRILSAAWSAGALDRDIDASALGLPDISGLLPGVTQPYIRLVPVQPPILLPSREGGVGLQLGDLRVEVHDGPPGRGGPALAAFVSAEALAAFTVDGEQLGIDLVDARTWFDIVVPEQFASAETEDVLAEIVPLVLPMVGDLMGGIELPSMLGLSLSTPSLEVLDGTVVLEGHLAPAR